MIIDNLTQKFINTPVYLDNGAGFLAKKFNCSKEEVYAAKDKARSVINNIKMAELQNIISEQEDVIAKYVGSESTDTGSIKKFESKKPLSPKEIEELSGVDSINTYVARVWDKLLPSGVWTYSIDIRWRVKDFYTSSKLKEKLRELMPDLTPVVIKKPLTENKYALVICLADDHAGAVNKMNLFGNENLSYKERLMKVIEEISCYNSGFEEVHVISLGDQMNGWNKQTTRGGHIVDSLSNEEQFDIYVEGRVAFYNALFTSGIGASYFVHDVENSNHSGLGMSYMANKTLEMYLDAKFPEVVRESVTEMISGFEYGKHVIIFGHGKDEKFQKRPMPAVLNAATDLYLYDYIQNKGYSPYERTVSFFKGDLHQHGIQHGKFGRYVNVQSLSGFSDYSDANFGNTKGGAVVEIFEKDTYKVFSQAVWF